MKRLSIFLSLIWLMNPTVNSPARATDADANASSPLVVGLRARSLAQKRWVEAARAICADTRSPAGQILCVAG